MPEKLKEIISDLAPDKDISTVTGNTRLKEDLGFDSLSIMTMSMELEEALGFRFEEHVVFATVGDVINYLDTVVK
ncbi:MAG: acyl carrier protein [Clostridia bacterium]|nr:acyl carrier protein [Clostridia bacterium]